MKSLVIVSLIAVCQYALALLVGVSILFGAMTVLGLAKGPSAPVNITATIGMFVMFFFVGGIFFCIPGGFSAFLTAVIIKSQKIKAVWILALSAAGVAFVSFYVLLTLHSNIHLARVQSVESTTLFPRENLSQVAVWTAPIAFAVCTAVTNMLYRRMFLRPHPIKT